jgi:hypothetical protein
MAKLGGTFDATGVEPNAPLEALPPGDYRVQILQSEMRVTKAGTGQLLWLDMEVLEGPLKGRHVYDQLNLINPNPTADPPQASSDRGAHRAPADTAARSEGRVQGMPDRGPARRVR